MRRIYRNIIFACAVALIGSCAHPELDIVQPVDSGEGLISLNLKNSSTPSTRALNDPVAADGTNEKKVDHLDIFIFQADGESGAPNTMHKHIWVDAKNIGENEKISLGKKADFQDYLNVKFWIYVIANSSYSSSAEASATFDAIPDFGEFCKMSEGHERVFLTGAENAWPGQVEIPSLFLMDGVAYKVNEVPVDRDKNAYSIVLNDGNNNTDLNLKVDLKRAAAKIVINIRENAQEKNDDPYVDFWQNLKDNTVGPTDGNTNLNLDGFYFRKLPYTTSLIADSRSTKYTHYPELRNTKKYNGVRFDNNTYSDKIVITTYAYARDWSSDQVPFIDRTSIIANIPLNYYEYTTERLVGEKYVPWEKGDEDINRNTVVPEMKEENGVQVPTGKYLGWAMEELPRNYYQIPISKDLSLVRNGYYEVTVDLSIPGGTDPGEPVAIEPVNFVVKEWTDKSVNVGGETDQAAYLYVNRNEMEMYNINHDNATLTFNSSHNVTVEVVNYYFIDKFGQPVYRYKLNDDKKTTYYDKDGKKVDDNTTPFIQSETDVTYFSEDVTGMTFSQAVSHITTRYPSISNADAQALVRRYTSFNSSYPVEWTTYETTDDPKKYVDYIISEDNALTESRIRSNLQSMYGLSSSEAQSVFNNHRSSLESYEEGWILTTTYYHGTIKVPRELVEHSDDLKGKNYEDAQVLLNKSDLSSSQIQNILNNQLQVVGTVKGKDVEVSDPALINITATATGLKGNIEINSPVPTNNAIRYIEVEVRNDYKGTPDNKADDLVEKIIIAQYPLVYITNIQGYYSYRDDFKKIGQSEPTTYQNLSSEHNIVGISFTGSTASTSSYTYNETAAGFWYSKVAVEHYDDGTANIHEYYYSNGKKTDEAEDGGNARMYHVRITSSSDEYKLGAPRITNGVTDPGADNAKMVSPSFMIASRLGFLNQSSIDSYLTADPEDEPERYEIGLFITSDHCKNYVEVYYDDYDSNGNPIGEKHVLDDWRLPTAEELNIIIGLQGTGTDADAIDYLLNAGYYWSASGPQRNGNYGSGLGSAASIRCIRDAF